MRQQDRLVTLPRRDPCPWDRFFLVAPLVLIGTREPTGEHNVAPKHLAMPLSWQGWFGFVCTPAHATWRNVVRTGHFTVSYPGPEWVLRASLSASPRCGPFKPALRAVPTFPARDVDGVLVEGCPVYLECVFHRTVDNLGENSLVIGRVVAVHVDEDVLRREDRSDDQIPMRHPLLAYVHPGRFARIDHTDGFPLPEGFRR